MLYLQPTFEINESASILSAFCCDTYSLALGSIKIVKSLLDDRIKYI